MCLDIKYFYLAAALDYFKYMRMPLSVFPEWVKKQYKLDELAQNGFVYLRMERAVLGLPQAGILVANKLLRKHLAPHKYYECINTPIPQQSLWTFLPGVATCQRTAHTLKWSISHAMFNPAFRCGIRC